MLGASDDNGNLFRKRISSLKYNKI